MGSHTSGYPQPPHGCCCDSEAKGMLAYESTENLGSQQDGSSRLLQLADELERVCSQYAEAYRKALRSPHTGERTMKRANEVTAKAQSTLTSMRRRE
ncbi:unnamed protein product [Prorocentrum cordatum]|uniref:Uncharacterized protein n=1 Tax=Prorocentrum cordatum TaxID=2364126 RepID=A0ABN9SXK7_9DINO|nr:unnamed protein product [Polarella glacialis]